ncbi:hypothetical protein [Streptomyces sp. NPDC058295]|uniref:hypothetical protein n=1 Tax=Streptomyces sp. NPDC058295 TaxID=3346431 RepID=UPI0036EEB336
MTAQGEDIPAWLDNAITKAASDAARWHDTECSFHGTTIIDLTVLQGGAPLCDCDGPTAITRRCAADRKLLDLHAGNMHSCPAKDETGYLDEWTHFGYEDTCPVVQGLADGYGWTEGQR